MRLPGWAGTTAGVAVIAVLVLFWHPVRAWLAYHTGSLNTSGSPPNYNFWSGSGSDLSELTLLSGLWIAYRHLNCHNSGCWRISTHAIAGGTYRVCRKHHNVITGHPERRLSTEFLARMHRQHLDRITPTPAPAEVPDG